MESQSYTPALSRRRILQVGTCGALGLSLPGLLRAQATLEGRTAPASIRSCIFVFYYGGPSHLDTFDMKPDAPAEVRGEFRPISTAVPGVHVCEHVPRLARILDKVALIRSMHHANRLHDSAAIETFTGRPSPNGDREEFSPIPQLFPSHGAALSHSWRSTQRDVSYAALPWVFHNVVDVPCQGGGFLGKAYDPFQITGDPERMTYTADALSRHESLPLRRIAARRALLDSLDRTATRLSAGPHADELRTYYRRAYDLLGSESLLHALDITREDQRTRDRYGWTAGESGAAPGAAQAYGRNLRGLNLLLARRLVEAGVPFVNVYDYRQQGQNWDAHADNFGQHRDHLLPPADQALSALIEDLEQRGLLDSTLVVALGEFGRTPTINASGGRDHWPDCYSILLAGGGVSGGLVYGASDRLGAYPDRDPVTPGDLAATIFWRFGLDPASEIHDFAGRPYRLADGSPIRALFA